MRTPINVTPFPEILRMNDETAIWPPYEAFYIESLLIITRSAMSNVVSLQNYHDQIDNNIAVETNQMLDSIQNIIRDSAALSRYFWPTSPKPLHQNRAAKLRSCLEMTEKSPLKKRNVRNFIEHFDEKLDEYLTKMVACTIIPSYVGPRYSNQQVGLNYFRAYFPQEFLFCVLNIEYNIKPIIDILSGLHDRLTNLSVNGGRLHSKPKSEI